MKRGRKPLFYVFYDKNDFVKFFGTSEDLVRDGVFKTRNDARVLACNIKRKIVKGNVVVLPLES